MASVFKVPEESIGLDPWTDITLPHYVGAYMFEVFLYGLCTSLFTFGVYLLCINRRTLRWTLVVITMCMFAIATADITLSLVFLFQRLLRGRELPVLHPHPKLLFFITNNLMAESVIIYRCYTVWRRKRLIVVVASAFLVSSSVCGYVFAISTSTRLHRLIVVYFWMTFALNVCLSVLTSGRIYWSARRASTVLDPDNPRRYYSIFAIIIDSGAIYPVYLLLDLVVNNTIVLDAGLNQIVVIVPALIICQREFGRCVQQLETSQLHDGRTTRSNPSTPILDSIFSLAITAPPGGQTTADDQSAQHDTAAPSHFGSHDHEPV